MNFWNAQNVLLLPEAAIFDFFFHLLVTSFLGSSIETRLVVIFIIFHIARCDRKAIQLLSHYTSSNRKLPTVGKNSTCTNASSSCCSANSSNVFGGVFRKVKNNCMIYRRLIEIYPTSCTIRTVVYGKRESNKNEWGLEWIFWLQLAVDVETLCAQQFLLTKSRYNPHFHCYHLFCPWQIPEDLHFELLVPLHYGMPRPQRRDCFDLYDSINSQRCDRIRLCCKRRASFGNGSVAKPLGVAWLSRQNRAPRFDSNPTVPTHPLGFLSAMEPTCANQVLWPEPLLEILP